ncbi:hypothetical protein, partial [Agrobacterium tumefaciens]|uniref:hypothetical protein n=1 Tax=Agrobacterium tumefaciens TaxID=358 RepID=UPI003BA25944
LPLQEQLGPSAQNIKGETQELDPDQQRERYLKAGQFSVETPGQLSVEINSLKDLSIRQQTNREQNATHRLKRDLACERLCIDHYLFTTFANTANAAVQT